jgi:hypothetical protein
VRPLAEQCPDGSIAQQIGLGSSHGARLTTTRSTSFQRRIRRNSFSGSLRVVNEMQPWHSSNTGFLGQGNPVAQSGQAAPHHVTVEAMPHDGGSLFAQTGL